ncbi:hypothetical protein LOK49_LG03G02314 [Camellia lanceoleosa]|uniref:Uncharacterized protein n=1 Tax=Camellia lanceoleosa TaxID=1840588 RepID=A0ACC0IDZ8_9ERIC|nr:hypothetical protein LOK49_LG03G02314 [Camellia lanceoleosa]
MAEESFLDLKPNFRKVREKLLFCNKWRIRFLMVGMSKKKLVKMCYKNDIGQTFNSEQDLMRYINYAKRAKVSIYAPNYTPLTAGTSRGRKKQRPNPPKVRKEAEKEAAGKQCSKGLMHASNESDEESNNPEVLSLPSELPKKVRHDEFSNSTSVFDDEVAEFHLSNYYQ